MHEDLFLSLVLKMLVTGKLLIKINHMGPSPEIRACVRYGK